MVEQLITHVNSKAIMSDEGSQVDIVLFYGGQKPKRSTEQHLICVLSLLLVGIRQRTTTDMMRNVNFVDITCVIDKDLNVIT